jgi:hypothetical protein
VFCATAETNDAFKGEEPCGKLSGWTCLQEPADVLAVELDAEKTAEFSEEWRPEIVEDDAVLSACSSLVSCSVSTAARLWKFPIF